jgi:hypothetical protein
MIDNWILHDFYLEPGKYLLRCEVLQNRQYESYSHLEKYLNADWKVRKKVLNSIMYSYIMLLSID